MAPQPPGAACASGIRTDLPFGIDPILITIDQLTRYDQLAELIRGIRERALEVHLDLSPLESTDGDARRKRISTDVAVAASILFRT